MLLLILAVVWAVVLVPPWLRSRADARPADSISAFRHRLTVLERTGPVGTRRVPMLAHRPDVSGFVPIARRPGPRTTAMSAMSSRARTQRRRRDIFVGMLAAMVTSLVLGFIPALRILWVVHLLVALCSTSSIPPGGKSVSSTAMCAPGTFVTRATTYGMGHLD